MKINDEKNINNEILKNIKNIRDKNHTKAKDLSQPESGLTDRVELSPEARKLQKIIEIVKETPDIREEKIRELKQAIESGTYQADSKEIAEKMILESLE